MQASGREAGLERGEGAAPAAAARAGARPGRRDRFALSLSPPAPLLSPPAPPSGLSFDAPVRDLGLYSPFQHRSSRGWHSALVGARQAPGIAARSAGNITMRYIVVTFWN
jgi:hypothetical protein